MSVEAVPHVELTDASVSFQVGGRRTKGEVRALQHVSLGVGADEVLGVVGESGSGKSTLGRALVGLQPLTSGTIRYGDGAEHRGGSVAAARAAGVQMVFQDPASSLNPRLRVGASVAEPLRNGGASAREARLRVTDLLRDVGLPGAFADRYPDQLSGGQQQRVALARALAASAALIVLDEAVSALDVSTQAHVLNLLKDLRQRHPIGYVFVSHDIAVVRFMATRVAVMYLGRIVELSADAADADAALHPYTVCLHAAVPLADPRRERSRRRIELAGSPPSPMAPPSGCAFHPRCPVATARCNAELPLLREVADGHWVACHFPGSLRLAADEAGAGTA